MWKLAVISVLSLVTASASGQADEADRLASEAADLFRVVMAAEEPPQRCQYRMTWDTYPPVPDYIAAKYLGANVHADLSAPQDIEANDVGFIDPEKRHGKAFCSNAEYAAYEKAQLDAFERDRTAKNVRVEATGFTFPIFDTDYRNAIVIVSRYGRTEERSDSGILERHPGYGMELAKIYAKTNDGWKLTASEVIGQS